MLCFAVFNDFGVCVRQVLYMNTSFNSVHHIKRSRIKLLNLYGLLLQNLIVSKSGCNDLSVDSQTSLNKHIFRFQSER